MKSNEAAERLIERLADDPIMAPEGGFADWDAAVILADDALAAERKATVERIRAKVEKYPYEFMPKDATRTILDAEAAR